MVWLDNSRIIAIFAVVFLHVAAGVVIGSDIGTESWWIGNLYDSLVRWCVPVFVMISGALLLDPSKKEDLRTFYLKRLSRILIPVLFWSAFFLLWATLKGTIKGEPLSIVDLAKRLLSGKPYYHMWFLYMIITLYLFTPFFRKIITNSSRNEIATLVFFTFVLSAINALAGKLFLVDSKLFINWFLSYIPYFFLGYLVRTSESDYQSRILWGIFVVSVILTAAGCYAVAIKEGLEAGLYFYSYLSITVIPMSISVMHLLKSWTKPIGSIGLTKKISALTLGVYLIHPIFIDMIQYAGYGSLAFYPVVSIPAITFVVFSLSLSGAWVINKVPYLKRVI
jgi:surface polysaccharide O-acyltransferase-like enzyme